MGKIVVVGSANVDLTIKLASLPKAGETVLADEFLVAGGGKGANQAVAARRAGAEVSFVFCVGADSFGAGVVKRLESYGVDTSAGRIEKNTHTGTGLIFTDRAGRNIIAVASGANRRIRPRDVKKGVISPGDVVMLQLEIPRETNEKALRLAKAAGATVILDPAPFPKGGIGRGFLRGVDFITPNEIECKAVCGIKPKCARTSREAARRLLDTGTKGVLLHLGPRGTVVATADGLFETVRAPKVRAVDTVAAGDVLNGAFAAELLRTCDPVRSARFAVAAAALSTMTAGAFPSIPSRAAVTKFARSL